MCRLCEGVANCDPLCYNMLVRKRERKENEVPHQHSAKRTLQARVGLPDREMQLRNCEVHAGNADSLLRKKIKNFEKGVDNQPLFVYYVINKREGGGQTKGRAGSGGLPTMAAILPHTEPAVKSFLAIFTNFSHLSRFPQLMEELWRLRKPIDQTIKS